MQFSINFALGVTFYDIQITIGNISWTVRRRYKEFVELHNKLVTGRSIGRDLLPPKKVGKTPPLFFYQRIRIRITNFVEIYSIQGTWQSIATVSGPATKGFGKISTESVDISAADDVPRIHRIFGYE